MLYPHISLTSQALTVPVKQQVITLSQLLLWNGTTN